MPRDKETTYRIMSAIKSKDTSPERLLGKTMWALGLRYRKNYKGVEGKPDFAFVNKKIAIFCDGDFWHGNNWRIRGLGNLDEELSSYSPFWSAKIRRNIERDNETNKALKDKGWTVLRFWESDLKKSPIDCANRVLYIYQSKKSSE